jgi:2-succinyl-5-enolpyruvyl-6-hydroxy-3-cyclohexene-1-carboxylate synthase
MLLPEVGRERQARAVAARAVALARGEPPGPVHVNFPFREPLTPAPGAPTAASTPGVIQGSRTLDRAEVAALARSLANARRGVIVCGPQDDPDFPTAVTELGEALGWPVLADLLSQVRCGPHRHDRLITSYDLFLRHPAVLQSLAADSLLRFGATPVSKPLQGYLERSTAHHIVVDTGGWPDPALVANEVVWADATELCVALRAALPPPQPDPDWFPRWRALDAGTRRGLQAALAAEPQLSEPGVFVALAEALPEQAALFLGNSMPVRDADTVLPALDRRIRLLANRGASGIDGVISTALGVAAMASPVVLVLGDISFYHDLNGLLAAKLHGLSATIVVLNNNGGGIFSFLPQAEQAEHFEELFGTPHGLDFAPVAAMYGLDYRVVASASELAAAVRRSIDAPGVQVLEVRTERAANVEAHRRIVAAALNALDPLPR